MVRVVMGVFVVMLVVWMVVVSECGWVGMVVADVVVKRMVMVVVVAGAISARVHHHLHHLPLDGRVHHL